MTGHTQEQETQDLSAAAPAGKRAKTQLLALLFVGLMVASGGVGLLYGPNLLASEQQEKPSGAPAMPPMPVETAEVRLADSVRQLAAVGSLRSSESVVLAAEIAGRIEKIAFNEGEQAERNRLLIKLDSAVQQAELDRALASRNLSKANYQRAEGLLKEHAVSKQERDEAYARWQLDEASVRLAKAQLDKTAIRTPFAGTLGLRQVSPGDYIQPGQPLVNLEAVAQLKVDFAIPEKFITEVAAGQQVALTSDAYPGRTFVAQVYAVDPRVDAASRSLTVRALLDNAERQLLPGQFVKLQLETGRQANALFIPEQAVVPQAKANLVFKVVDGKAQMVPVKLGQRRTGWVQIVDGLNEGDVVVTGGHQKIGPGSPVMPIPADPELFAKL